MKAWGSIGRIAAVGAVLGLAALPATGVAQSSIRLGVQGGLNFANLTGDDAGETDLVTGWNLGATARVGRGSLSLVPALLLTRKGATQSAPGFSSTLALTYLQLPLLARLRLSDAGASGSLGTHLFLGPAVGLKVGCSLNATFGFETVSSSCAEAEAEDPDAARFSDSEWSGIAGFGIDIGSASVALQYELGLSRIAEDFDLKTSTISAVVRYFWGAPRPDRNLMPRRP